MENTLLSKKNILSSTQTGKTSLLLALRDYLNQVGKYYALYINIELGQALRENVAEVW